MEWLSQVLPKCEQWLFLAMGGVRKVVLHTVLAGPCDTPSVSVNNVRCWKHVLK